ncbi:hypothetical protein NPIL_595481 [Nephila pilipes]|uniref:Uncharacterized protein n=1 Tax=Nephila pilipes TaxID=299642 RepID=A0A8X6N0S5_NEPPI|nr:hypothetical protein NPIL_595481 [Nephila pilipes]
MLLSFQFLLGLFISVQGESRVFDELMKIVPKNDICFLKLVMCDEDRKPLCNIEKCEFHAQSKVLQAYCKQNEKFIQCTEKAIKICKAVPHVEAGDILIEKRRFGKAFCSPSSSWKKCKYDSFLFPSTFGSVCSFFSY